MISYASSDGTSPWTAGYARQADGYDETLHLSTSSNSRIAFNVSASSLTLLIPTYQNCTATVSVNGSSPTVACATTSTGGSTIPFALYNLPDGIHQVVWDAGTVADGEEVIFWGVDGQRDVPSGMTNVTVDNAYAAGGAVSLTYEGTWTQVVGGGSSTLSEQSNTASYFNKTVAVSQSAGASVSFSGKGSAMYLYGPVGPDYGSASIALNGHIVTPRLNLTSPWSLSYELLWFQTGLDDSAPTNLTMTALDSDKLALDFILLSADSDTLAQLHVDSSTPFVATTVGKVVLYGLIPVLALLVIGLVTYFCLRKRRPARPLSQSTAAISLNDQSNTWEKKRASVYSAQSNNSAEDVFVSYDDGRAQRLSDRWHASPVSASSSRSGQRLFRTLSPQMPSVPESTATSPSESSAASPASWVRPFHSILGSSYARSSRRVTALPAYTLESSESEGTHSTQDHAHGPVETETTWTSAEAEKAVLDKAYGGSSIPLTRSLSDAGPSTAHQQLDVVDLESLVAPSRPTSTIGRLSTVAPSSILSIFGAPPSLHRTSSIPGDARSEIDRASRPTINTDVATLFRPSAPTPSRGDKSGGIIMSPFTVNGSVARASLMSGTSSPGSALRAWIALPPTAFVPMGRSRTQSSVVSERSAARPDSGIVPTDSPSTVRSGRSQLRMEEAGGSP